MKLTTEEDKIIQKAIACQWASEKFNRYCLYRGRDKNFTEEEAERLFKLLKGFIKDLKNYCVNCGSDT